MHNREIKIVTLMVRLGACGVSQGPAYAGTSICMRMMERWNFVLRSKRGLQLLVPHGALVPPDDVLAPSLQQSTNQPFFYCYLSKRWCTYRRRQSPDANAATRPLYYAPHWLLSTWWSRYRRSSRNQLVRPVPPPPVTFTTIEGKRPLLC